MNTTIPDVFRRGDHPGAAVPAAWSAPQPGPDAENLLELLPHPACRTDAVGNIRFLNAAWRRLAGPAEPGPAPGFWVRMIAREDGDLAISRMLAATMTGQAIDFECRLIDGQGQGRWHLLCLLPHRGDAVHGDGWLCIATDIHALKLRELELQSLARIQTEMLNVGQDCIKLIAPDGRLIHMNRAGCVALGVAEGSPFGMAWLELLPPQVREAGAAALAEACTGRPARFAGSSALPGRPPQHWDNALTPMKGGDGQVTAILCVSREVTAERAAQELLRQGQERLALAARVGGLGIWDYDLKNDALQCDESWYRIMGRDPARPIRSIAEFRPCIHPEDVARATEVEKTAAELVAVQGDYGIVFRIVRPGGEVRWVRSAACVLQDAAGAAVRAVGFVVDITDAWHGELALRDRNRVLAEEKESFARQCLEDPLTGVANRRFLDGELARIGAHAGGQAVTVAMVDVDHFKAYNDRYGHLKGDDALRGVAGALQSIARRTDFVARYGGEEFVVVFPGVDSPEPVLQRLGAAIEALGLVHEASPFGRITVSCGCVVFAHGSAPVPALLLKACDEALYEAKAGGRNRHVVRFCGS